MIAKCSCVAVSIAVRSEMEFCEFPETISKPIFDPDFKLIFQISQHKSASGVLPVFIWIQGTWPLRMDHSSHEITILSQ